MARIEAGNNIEWVIRPVVDGVSGISPLKVRFAAHDFWGNRLRGYEEMRLTGPSKTVARQLAVWAEGVSEGSGGQFSAAKMWSAGAVLISEYFSREVCSSCPLLKENKCTGAITMFEYKTFNPSATVRMERGESMEVAMEGANCQRAKRVTVREIQGQMLASKLTEKAKTSVN